MERLTLKGLEEQAAEFDRLIESTPGIDIFCSSSDWALPAQAALMPERESWLWRSEAGYVAMMKGQHPEGFAYLQPLEGMWLLGSPFAAAEEQSFVRQVSSLLVNQKDWDVTMLAGVNYEQPWVQHLLSRLAADFRVYRGPATIRIAANIHDGLDGFLADRTRYFRRNLRRNIARCGEERIEFQRLDFSSAQGVQSGFERMMNVEAGSWKGLEQAGVNEGCMREFYTLMLPRLVRRGAARLIMATRDGEDLGFILGGIRLNTYRGLQFSFNENFRALGLGNVLQYEALKDLCDEGIAVYDLGTDIEYKRRWGRPYLTTSMFTVARS